MSTRRWRWWSPTGGGWPVVCRDGTHAAELDIARVAAVRPRERGISAVLSVLRRWAELFRKELSPAGLAATLQVFIGWISVLPSQSPLAEVSRYVLERQRRRDTHRDVLWVRALIVAAHGYERLADNIALVCALEDDPHEAVASGLKDADELEQPFVPRRFRLQDVIIRDAVREPRKVVEPEPPRSRAALPTASQPRRRVRARGSSPMYRRSGPRAHRGRSQVPDAALSHQYVEVPTTR